MYFGKLLHHSRWYSHNFYYQEYTPTPSRHITDIIIIIIISLNREKTIFKIVDARPCTKKPTYKIQYAGQL